MRMLIAAVAAIAVAGPTLADDREIAGSWGTAKNWASDKVYHDNPHTLYCGCEYESHDDSDGSGDVSMPDCGMTPLSEATNTTTRIEWEHIVPASQLPARQHVCWKSPTLIAECKNKGLSGRACCERTSADARRMVFDLHNLAPSVGQVNQYRKNGRYGDVPDDSTFEKWEGCDVRDQGGIDVGRNLLFEPVDCTKGDLARVWFYMYDEHGLVIPDSTWNTLVEWADDDPVSPWESERDKRIAQVQGNHNPYVEGWEPDPAGACSWDPVP